MGVEVIPMTPPRHIQPGLLRPHVRTHQAGSTCCTRRRRHRSFRHVCFLCLAVAPSSTGSGACNRRLRAMTRQGAPQAAFMLLYTRACWPRA